MKLPKHTTVLHGTISRFCEGCHCDDCRAAWNAYQRERYREKRGSGWKAKVAETIARLDAAEEST